MQNTAKRTSTSISQELIDQVQRGRIPVGAPLPTERELCEIFESSRPTVREAISRIQILGYATRESGKRPRVTQPSLKDVLETMGDRLQTVLGGAEGRAHLEQMRQYIEAGAAREAAKRASAGQIAKIKAALEANFDAIGTPDFARTDIAFHRAIVAVADNLIMLTLHDMFVGSFLADRPPLPDRQAHDEVICAEHRAVFEAILRSDEGGAAELIDSHLDRSYRNRISESFRSH